MVGVSNLSSCHFHESAHQTSHIDMRGLYAQVLGRSNLLHQLRDLMNRLLYATGNYLDLFFHRQITYPFDQEVIN